jgi:hypothetical protein
MKASAFAALALLLTGCGQREDEQLRKALGLPEDAIVAYEEVRSPKGRALCGVDVATMRRFAFHRGQLYRSPEPQVTRLCPTAVLGGSKA